MARVGDPRRGRKPKAPAAVTNADDGLHYRSRPTRPGPFGDDEPPYFGPLAEVLERAEVDRQAGMEPVVEYRTPGTTWAAWRRPLLLDDLAQLGLARAVTHMVKGGRGGEDDPSLSDGKKEVTRWEITPEGQEMLRAASRGQLPMSAWPTRAYG